MPALPSIPNIIRAGFRFGNNTTTQIAGVALHYAYTGGPPGVSDVAGVALDLKNAFGTHVASQLSHDYGLDEVVVTDLSSPTGATAGDGTATVNGTLSGSTLQAGTCALAHYDITRRYRGGHPKSFWPLGDEDQLATIAQWNSTFVTNVSAALAAFEAAALAISVGGSSLSHQVNVSYFHGSTPFTLPGGRVRNIPTLRGTPLVDQITFGFVNPIIGSQRRRRGKV